MKKRCALHATVLVSICVIAGAPGFAQTQPPAGMTLPTIPAPVAVALDAKSTALLMLDFNVAVCKPNPACIATVPATVSFAKRAREAKVPVIYTTAFTPGPSPLLDDVKPQPGEPTVAGRPDKFIDSNLEELLKQRNATTLILVGTLANGAILYTASHANARGFTVVVAEDGMSSFTPFNNFFVRYQLLQQPGFANPTNTPLAEKKVTLSRMDLITFK